MPEVASLTLSPLLEHALIYVIAAVASIVAFTNWRRRDARAFREPLIAFLALWFIEGALFAAEADPQLLPVPLVHGLAFAALVLLMWGLLAPSLSPRAGGAILGGGITLAAALTVFSISAARTAGGVAPWIDSLWSIGSVIVTGGSALALGVRRSPDRVPASIAAFTALAVSVALDTLLLPDLARISRLIGFSLFPIALYQRALTDLRLTQDTLRELSESALKQTQQLVTLLETSTYLFSSLDMDDLLHRVVEHTAVGIDSNRVMLALTDNLDPQMLRVASCYPRELVKSGSQFTFDDQPALAEAILSGEQRTPEPRGAAAALARLLKVDPASAVIIQPLSTPDATLGAIAAAGSRLRREFSSGQKRLLEALGAQIAAAIENARLYGSLDLQARELVRVLTQREEEVGWHAAILESIGDGVIITDTSDIILRANVAAAHILDTPRDRLIGQPVDTVFGKLLLSSSIPLPVPLRASTERVRAAFSYGDSVINVSLAPVSSLAGQRLGLVAVFRDVTAAHRADRNRAEFVHTIVREFHTRLDTIRGHAELLAKGAAGGLPPAAAGFVETVRDNADRLAAQVSSILQFNELERGGIELSIEAADAAAILAEAAAEHRPKLEARRLSLDLNVKPNLPAVRADRARVRQVLDQLIDNAVKFTPDGGRIRLSAAPSWDGQTAERPAYVALSVEDSGAGIDPRDRERIFESFYRADGAAQLDPAGLGIGLSIARGLCEAMGGHLWARSGAERGSIFTFILPVAPVPDTRPASASPDADTSIESWIERALTVPEDGDGGSAAAAQN